MDLSVQHFGDPLSTHVGGGGGLTPTRKRKSIQKRGRILHPSWHDRTGKKETRETKAVNCSSYCRASEPRRVSEKKEG